jgi:hypothetical protein
MVEALSVGRMDLRWAKVKVEAKVKEESEHEER